MMKRFSVLGSKKSSASSSSAGAAVPDTPEFNAPRAVRKFCEAAAPGQAGQQNDEAVHLPMIVESCESSPQAASAAAYQIRKFLSKDNFKTPHLQYNASMLIRILADNPGAIFTKNIDGKFVTTVRDLLRNSPDPSVQHILRETLVGLARDKKADSNLDALLKMWDKEKGAAPPMPYGRQVLPPMLAVPPQSHARRLPPLAELAGRINEARTSAQLLNQIVLSTPVHEFAHNELIREFADRCAAAQRNMQAYMNATDPAPPDEATLKTLIETAETLSVAMNRHQRAVLASRQAQSQAVAQNLVPIDASMAPAPGQTANAFAATPADPFSDAARIPPAPQKGALASSTEVPDDEVPPPGPPPGKRAAPAIPTPRLSAPDASTPPRTSEDDLYGTSPAHTRAGDDHKPRDFANPGSYAYGNGAYGDLPTTGMFASSDAQGAGSRDVDGAYKSSTRVIRDDDPLMPGQSQSNWR